MKRGQIVGFGKRSAEDMAKDKPRYGPFMTMRTRAEILKDAKPPKPYFVSIHWFDDKPPLNQPVTETELLILMTKMRQSCSS